MDQVFIANRANWVSILYPYLSSRQSWFSEKWLRVSNRSYHFKKTAIFPLNHEMREKEYKWNLRNFGFGLDEKKQCADVFSIPFGSGMFKGTFGEGFWPFKDQFFLKSDFNIYISSSIPIASMGLVYLPIHECCFLWLSCR